MSVLNEIFSFFGYITWYYIAFAIIFYGIIYILEVQLDLPLAEHEKNPGDNQTELKHLIQLIIDEILKIPNHFDYSNISERQEIDLTQFDPGNYNDLLATAVLNKIVDSYQNHQNIPYPLCVDKTLENSKEFDDNHNERVSNNLNDGFVLRSTEYNENFDNIDDIDGEYDKISISMTNEEQQDHLDSSEGYNSNTGENHFNTEYEHIFQKREIKLPQYVSELEIYNSNDDVQSNHSSSTTGTWEDNWLLKTRKFKGENRTTNGNITAMLVPSPTEDVKALIGDQNADEISDLSEAEDDDDMNLSNEENDDDINYQSEDIPNILIQNKTVIGGKHNLMDFVETKHDFDSLTESNFSSNSLNDAKNDCIEIISDIIELNPENEIKIILNHDKDNESNDWQNQIKETKEIFIKNDEIPFEIISENKPIPAPRKSSNTTLSTTNSTKDNLSECDLNDTLMQVEKTEPVFEPAPIPGSIAEREHMKWKNAAPLENNPYSAEVLQKRLGQKIPTPLIELNQLKQSEVDNDEPISLNDKDDKEIELFPSEKLYVKKLSRDYYIKEDPISLIEIEQPSSSQSSNIDISSPTPDKVSHLNETTKFYQHQNQEQYILNRFLNNFDNFKQKNSSLKSFKSLRSDRFIQTKRPSSNLGVTRSRKTSEIDLAMFEPKRAHSVCNYRNIEIPSKFISRFEENILHGDMKRNSFRSQKSLTKNFVINPLYDKTNDELVKPTETRSYDCEIKNNKSKSSTKNQSNFEFDKSENFIQNVFINLTDLRRSKNYQNDQPTRFPFNRNLF